MVSVKNTSIPGGGPRLKNQIWDAARNTIQEWTGEKLIPCSLYGVCICKKGEILAPHVDRLPLVSSAIINVAQDVDEDWPIEVYAHNGKAYNITMEPGDMVLYKSHSVIHGKNPLCFVTHMCLIVAGYGSSYLSVFPADFLFSAGRPFPLIACYYANILFTLSHLVQY